MASLGLPLFRMPSGAGHDAMKLHEVMPQAMLFQRGLNAGISHNRWKASPTTTPSCACALSSTCSNNGHRNNPCEQRLRPPRRLDRRPFRRGRKFLQALVRVPTDTPPSNNAPHAERTAALLQDFGYSAEKHPVPAQEVRTDGLESITNLIVRRRFGDGR